MRARTRVLLLLALLAAQPAAASVCASDEAQSDVTGVDQCLLMRRYGAGATDVLLVFIHGDVSAGGPADYHYAIAERAAREFAAAKVTSVALVRPGYGDASGRESTVAMMQRGRSDHYTRENLAEVGAAIERLRGKLKPRTVIVIGHSGGAATAAILLGMMPGLIDAAVLVSCPCDLVAWRSGRRAWSRSENPLDWADRVDAAAHVVALTGANDDNTLPALAQAYVDKLRARKVDAKFDVLPGATHNGAFKSPAVLDAVRGLLPANAPRR